MNRGDFSRLHELVGDRTLSQPTNGYFRLDVENLFNPNTKEDGVGMNLFGAMIVDRANSQSILKPSLELNFLLLSMG